MPRKFGTKSTEKLETCHNDLQRLMRTVIQRVDCTIIVGYRSNEEQNELFRLGKSYLKGGRSKHNHMAEVKGSLYRQSLAVDAAPWFENESPHIRWNDKLTQVYFAGIVLGTAQNLGISIRCGADWNQDFNVSNNWLDAFHFELT